jgi:hypothetical protein|tara:strand:- start:1418 stop:1741 length:324 start_codon:yes stop_codon:yes gene_type:complete
MLNRRKLRRQAKKADQAQKAEKLRLAKEMFTPSLIAEWEKEIKSAALRGRTDVCIKLKFSDRKFDNPWVYEIVCDKLANSYFKGFKCRLVYTRNPKKPQKPYISITW